MSVFLSKSNIMNHKVIVTMFCKYCDDRCLQDPAVVGGLQLRRYVDNNNRYFYQGFCDKCDSSTGHFSSCAEAFRYLCNWDGNESLKPIFLSICEQD